MGGSLTFHGLADESLGRPVVAKAFLIRNAGVERSVGFIGGALFVGQHAKRSVGFGP